MRYLLFQLYGPTMSWGGIAVGETRATGSHPTRSAILGLLAAASGIRREEETRLQDFHRSFETAVIVGDRGSLLRDYHTVQAPTRRKEPYRTRKEELAVDDPNTLLSTREYRMDSYHVAVVWQRDDATDWTIDALRENLLKPQFQLYLGRKASPLGLPMAPTLIEAATIRAAFDTWSKGSAVHLAAAGVAGYSPFNAKSNDLYTGMRPTDGGISMGVTVRDDPTSRKRWQFAERMEYRQSLGSPVIAEEGGHDAH